MTRALPSRLVLLGHPVSHSLSPALQNAAIRYAGIDATYEAVDVAPSELERFVIDCRSSAAAGNVTIPHKRRMFALCDRLTGAAQRTGAVNTFWTEGDELWGENTDVSGFDSAARMLLQREPRLARIALIGAGGGAAAVLMAVESWTGSRVAVFNRTTEGAVALASRFHGCAYAAPSIQRALAGASLAVNATPVGLRSDELPFPLEFLDENAAVFDLVYRRGETALVRKARALGHRAVDGREMLVEQGALAFTRWFGVEPNRMVMRQALDDALSGDAGS